MRCEGTKQKDKYIHCISVRVMRSPDVAVVSPYSMIKQVRGMFWHCALNAEQFNDPAFLKDVFIEAIRLSNATVVKIDEHRYEPHGITMVAILEDSHAVLHTWPENSFAMAEIFTCGLRATPAIGIEHLASRFKPLHRHVADETIHL